MAGRCRRRSIAEVYPKLDDFFDDLGQAYKKAVRAFADAGCRYLQLDEVFIAMLCDPKYRQQMKDRGDDPEKLGELYGDLINTAMSDIPSDMRITMHLCRGNYQSTFMGAGGYEAEQEMLFNRIKVHGYFMEYDSRPRRRLRAVAARAKGPPGRARPRHHQDRPAGIEGRPQAPHRGGRANTFRSTSFACRRNAASPRRKRATRSPKKSSGPSCA